MDESTITEEWRPIPSAPLYEASSLGRVRTLPRTRDKRKRGKRLVPLVLKLQRAPNGYRYIQVSVSGVARRCAVHRLVAEAFLGTPPAGSITRHLDGDRSNNRANNLSWGTSAQNAADTIRHDRFAWGERNGLAKLTDDGVRAMRRRFAAGESYTELSRAFGVTRRRVFLIVTREAWKHVA